METLDPLLNSITRRLRWVMLGVILLNFCFAVIGQPATYWHHPKTANESNQLFHFFMVRGPAAWFGFESIYLLVAFLVASMACGRAALIGIFSYILGHYFGACTGLVLHWQLGSASFIIYGILLACVIVVAMLPPPAAPRP